MRIDRFVRNNSPYNQKQVRRLMAKCLIKADGEIIDNGRFQITPFTKIELDDKVLQDQQAYYLMLHKPMGCLSATKDDQHPTVLDLIDTPYKQQLHIGGRLDFNTTGLMLLTNDGKWSQRISAAAERKPKVYYVETEQKISEQYREKFEQGVYFSRENITTHPAQLDILANHKARLTIYEGRYHQVKRMFGFFDNKVTALHRERMDKIVLDPNLKPGQYRPLTQQEINSVN
ncbi:16S rRNA pseudouridine(516) synthase [Oceanicoccus sagamiensis]|uniref:Pseudouridine synthase n=1 Tax=Oceanicoccus sagamiensis TaxID=716816 RepID=A0A1X9NEF0_9GAMM|nr:16S rRNA pseudouridine(516) synthase [Oceanicoccus sagamiensis]ARN74265.1 16S rRNA pseudouridine(516) synthase [Oceanicoccus sagamiensis]